MATSLSERELDFLRATSSESAQAYARRNHYSRDWAKWISRRIREKLGVPSLDAAREVAGMSEVTRSDLEALERRFTEGLEKIAGALSTPKDTPQSGPSLDTELRLRGLTARDLDSFAEEKRKRQIRAELEALRAEEREAEEAKAKADAEAAAAAAAEENGAGDEPGIGQRIRDGLGGKTWAT